MIMRLVVSLLILVFISACGQRNETTSDPAPKPDLYSLLAIVEIGLDFPRSEKHLADCQRLQDSACLKVYESFIKAKKEFLLKDKNVSLKETLNKLQSSCVPDAPTMDKYSCSGALVALNFFTTTEYDKSIRDFLSNLSETSRQFVLDKSTSMNFSWLENRSDSDAWRTWLASRKMEIILQENIVRRLSKEDLSDIRKILQNS